MYLAATRITLCFFCASVGIMSAHAQVQPGLQEVRERQGKDTNELYYEAWLLCQESEKLAKAQNYAQAILKGNMAEQVLARLVRDFPTWKENMVRERRKLLAENLAEYRKKQAENPLPPSVPLRGVETDGGDGVLPSIADLERKRQQGAGNPVVVAPPVHPSPVATAEQVDMYQQVQRLKKELNTVVNAYRDVQSQLAKANDDLKEARSRQQFYKKSYEELMDRITSERKVSNEMVATLNERLMQLESDYKASEQRREAAERSVAELERKLAETQDMLEEVTRQRDALAEENRKLQLIVEMNSPEKIKSLLDQNMTLAAQLKDAQARLAAMEASKVASEDQMSVNLKELDKTREEIARLKGEMSTIYAENLGYRRRISELNTRLTNLEAELEKAAMDPKIDPVALEENKLLREIIAKQKNQLAMNEQGRKMMIAAYKNLNAQSPLLEEVIRNFDEKSSLELTPAEQSLVASVAQPLSAVQDGAQDAVVEGTSKILGDAVREQLRIETLGKSAADAFANGRYEAAEQLYETLLDKQPDHAAARVNMGAIKMQRNDMPGAIENFKKAILLSPKVAMPYFLCGSAMYRAGEEKNAIGMFQKTVELDPANATAFFYLGNLEGSQGNRAKALNYFACAVKLKPDLADAHYNMSRLYAEENRIPEACRAYDKAVKAGAAPDMEFFSFLEHHPDRGKAAAPEPDPDVNRIARGDTPEPDADKERKVEKKPLEMRKATVQRLQKKDGSIVEVSVKKKDEGKGKPSSSRRRSRKG